MKVFVLCLELVINAIGPEIRVALLEDGTIVELYVDRSDESNVAGNIYKGRIQRVLPGMQAAFVDIGLNQAAFIYVDDVIDEKTNGYLDRVYLSNNDEEDGSGLLSFNFNLNPRVSSMRFYSHSMVLGGFELMS